MDGIVLPGIDSPVPAPAAPAPEPSPAAGGEQSSAPSASVEPAPAPTPAPEPTAGDGEPAPQGDGKPGAKRSFQGRIGELVGQRRELESRLQQEQAYNRQLVEAFLRQQQPQQPLPQPEAPPDPELYRQRGKSYNEYYSDLAEYKARQMMQRGLAEYDARQRMAFQQFMMQQNQVNAEQAAHQVIGQDMNAAAARYPDYVETIAASTADIPARVSDAIASSGAPGDVAYYLAKNEQLVPRLNQLSDLQLRQAMGRIALFQRTQPPAQSNAPAPGRPAGGARAGPVSYSKDMSPEEHAKMFDPMGRRRTK